MNKLEKNFEQYLPMNRKERFFTGTVLPQIICRDNFKLMYRFLELIEGFPKNININPGSDFNNIQFLTEYSLKESSSERFFGRTFSGLPDSKDTPDLVILFTEPEMYLVVIEAKMYSSANEYDLKRQMQNQKKFVEVIAENLAIQEANIFHVALVPAPMFPDKKAFLFGTIYWEEVLEKYQAYAKGDYFWQVLKLALNKYDNLKSGSQRVYSTYVEKRGESMRNETVPNEWDFKHLGREYFENIMWISGINGKGEEKIDALFIGSSGVPYSEKKNGRNVNPNWCLVSTNGRKMKGGPRLGKLTEPGLWNLSNCLRFSWSEIKEHFRL
ncbi:MAG: hypothetical protein SCALA702_02160 [Melioribacteraceae bacterium]|nr:MAG: hypothetical protein SCALA702_02160 [Melioribacteraceae bacterium]